MALLRDEFLHSNEDVQSSEFTDLRLQDILNCIEFAIIPAKLGPLDPGLSYGVWFRRRTIYTEFHFSDINPRHLNLGSNLWACFRIEQFQESYRGNFFKCPVWERNKLISSFRN